MRSFRLASLLTPVLVVLPLLPLLGCVVVATGCSSSAEDDAASGAAAAASARGVTATSGTRLRARFTTGGGARELVGFFDTERNEECTFQRADDGRMRCLPSSFSYGEVGMFSDAACQTPLAVPQGACTGDATYAVSSVYESGCTNTARARSVRKVVGQATASYVSTGGGCTAQAGFTPSARFVALGEVIPWTAFLEAVETTVPGDQVSERVLVASDGARQHLGYRNEKLGAECTFQLMADGITRCVPDDARSGPVEYSDAACTIAVGVTGFDNGQPCGKGASSPLWIARDPNGGVCALTRGVYSLKSSSTPPEERSSTYAFSSSGSGAASSDTPSCSSASPAPSYGRRDIEADVTSTLPAVPRIDPGGGRLVRALVARSGEAGLVPGWHDNERDADCTFERASDGKLRCLPTAAPATIFFTDGECKSTSRVAVLGQAPCTGPSRFARVTSATCPPTTRVFELGADLRDLPGASAETNPGRCVSVAGVNRAYDATEADPASFVEGVPVVE
jgi:hypothetical protein